MSALKLMCSLAIMSDGWESFRTEWPFFPFWDAEECSSQPPLLTLCQERALVRPWLPQAAAGQVR